MTDDFAHVVHLSTIDSAARLVDRPDAFGFYRPVTQTSLAIDLQTHGSFAAMRALNILLHAACIALTFIVARAVLGSPLAAGLATLAFALTPKAHPIAALWISARAELLMALFSLASVAAWIAWTRRGRWTWLAVAALTYALALMSKETATLLPVVLLFTPRAERSWSSRGSAVVMLVALGLAIYGWRAHVGALTPFAGDGHYDLMVPLSRWIRSATNYAGRMLIAPLGLVTAAAVAWAVSRRSSGAAAVSQPHVSIVAFSCIWTAVFLAPVLPIVLRSELYLYLPVFGLSLLAGSIAAAVVERAGDRGVAAIAISVCGIILAGYQIARASDIHRNLIFSQRLVAAITSSEHFARRDGNVAVLPADATTERLLRNAIGGYVYLVLQHARPGSRLNAVIQYGGDPAHQADLRLVCRYRQDTGAAIISLAP